MMTDSRRLYRTRLFALFLMTCVAGTAFVASSATAAVSYTGSVETTDNTGATKTTFFQGEPVFANVGLAYEGAPYNDYITVSLVRTTDGMVVSHYHAWTNNPEVGWTNGSVTGYNLFSGTGFDGDLMTYDVVATVVGQEFARASIVVIKTGLSLEPDTWGYGPGQEISITLGTTHTTDVFYVQIVNETGATKVNWTGQVALDGRWFTTWTIPDDFPDGTFVINVRDTATHAIWNSNSFLVQKYGLFVMSDRDYLLPGESAHITYTVLDVATFTQITGVTVNYSAHWVNDTGGEEWQNGTLAGSDGMQTYDIPTDIALCSDTEITYWANETAGTRSVESYLYLYTGVLQADIQIDSGPYVPGQEVEVRIIAEVGSESLAGAEVDISVEKNMTLIAGYGAADLFTGADGTVSHRFILATDASRGSYVVTATISKAGHIVTRTAVFNVEWSGELVITLDKTYYHSGEAVGLEFQTFWNNEEVTGASVFYVVVTSAGVLETGSTTSGAASFTIPITEYYYFYVEALVNLDGYQMNNWAAATVTMGDVVIAPADDNYAALDRIEFNYEVVTLLTTATLEYTITDDNGMIVANAGLPFSASGSIAYDVPAVPSASYTCTLVLSTSGGQEVRDDATAHLLNDYEFVITAGSSPYLSGQFKPGETLDIEYAITPRGAPSLPLYVLIILTSWSDSTYTLVTSDEQGTLQMQIPATASNGYAYVQASLYDGVSDEWLADSTTALTISDDAGEWDTTIGDMQNETERLRLELIAARDALNETDDDLEGIQTQLDNALSSLNVTLDELSEMQEQMDSLGDDIEGVDGEISDRPTSGTIAMWVVIAIIVSAVIAVALTMLVSRRK